MLFNKGWLIVRKIILLVLIVLVVPLVSATNKNQTHPASQVTYGTFDYGDFVFRDNVTADYFIGNGSYLTDIFNFTLQTYNTYGSRWYSYNTSAEIGAVCSLYPTGNTTAEINAAESDPNFDANILANRSDNVDFGGNITSENVFVPQYIFSHTNRTQSLVGANIWTNVTFDQEVADISFGISHTSTDDTNHTFTIMEDGIYEVDYDFDIEDVSDVSSDINVAGRIVLVNGTEIVGSVFETDIQKKGIEAELSHDFLIRCLAGEQFKFQFIADDAEVQISTHGLFGDHPESATIVIKKVANIN